MARTELDAKYILSSCWNRVYTYFDETAVPKPAPWRGKKDLRKIGSSYWAQKIHPQAAAHVSEWTTLEGVVAKVFTSKNGNEVNRRLQEVRFINPGDSLKESFVVVEEMIKEGIIQKYAVTGATGALCYIEPIDTRDADFIIEFPEGRIDVLGPLFDFLVSRGYQELTSDGYVRVGDWPIQFVAVTSELKQEALDTSVRAKLYPDSTVSVVRAEYLAAEALSVGRSKDRVRLERLLEIPDSNRGLFDGLVKKFELTDKWNRFSGSYGP